MLTSKPILAVTKIKNLNYNLIPTFVNLWSMLIDFVYQLVF